ncbi:peptidylprolyl isomerase [Glycomyces xiaoerkulensis]|uniref:peptidylprolyl isomerase n=1 Tax=Glycomyces xiaoerkulensis TaxID=2038139 RepID=UPI0018E48394|nr:peptidylprolyl isomerase [Glycomyces xiaoerkulensis]
MASKQAQRIAARAQLQQRMAEKAEEEKKRRTVLWSLGGVGALVVLVVAAWITFGIVSGDDEDDGEAAEAPTTAPAEEEPAEEEPAQPTDGLPAQEVIIDSLAMSEPESGATAECEYSPSQGSEGAETPPATQPAAGTQEMTIETGLGTITADIDTEAAPCTAGAFTYLSGQGYFDTSQCHRLTTEGIFVLQCGDPTAREAIEAGMPEQAGTGGPGFQYAEENLPEDGENNYPAGTIAMANAGPGTTGSQFFIVYDDSTLSPANYTILGEITGGLDIVEEVADAGAM